jgi:hypothetical protein
MTTTAQPRRKCIDNGTCHHECNPSECFREEHCAPFSDSGLNDNWKPIASLPLPAIPDQSEPVAYQYRIKTDNTDAWYSWQDCSKENYDELMSRPNVGSLAYQVRKLFAQDPSSLLARIAELEAKIEEMEEDAQWANYNSEEILPRLH